MWVATSAAVARAWARDPRLSGWLAGLPAVEEPKIRETAVWSLDETPSPAYRDWVIKLAGSETDPEVLDSA